MFKKIGVILLMSVFVVGISDAAIKKIGASGTKQFVGNNELITAPSGVDDDDFDMTGMDEAAVVAKLEADIAEIKALREECEKQRKGWVAATAVGSAGVVATGVAAIVQGQKLKDAKSELSGINPNWNQGNNKGEFLKKAKNFIGGN